MTIRLSVFAFVLLAVTGGVLHSEDERLSDVEQLRLELHRTQVAYEQALATGGACRAQLRELQLTADQAALKTRIEQAHPGFAVDLASGQLAKKAETK